MDLIAPTWWRVALPAAGVVLGALAYGAFAPRSRLFGPVAWRSERPEDASSLALLFEGPLKPENTLELLARLQTARAKAAFAVDTDSAEAMPGLVRRIDGAGHLIVNAGPGFSVAALTAGYVAWRSALDRAEDAIHDATGRRPLLFAPTYSMKSPVMLREAGWCGMGLVVRSRGSHGWLPSALDRMRLLHGPTGGVVSMRGDRARTLAQLPGLLDAWRLRGRDLERLDQLFGVPGYRSGGATD